MSGECDIRFTRRLQLAAGVALQLKVFPLCSVRRSHPSELLPAFMPLPFRVCIRDADRDSVRSDGTTTKCFAIRVSRIFKADGWRLPVFSTL
jgi:hypothetical protein